MSVPPPSGAFVFSGSPRTRARGHAVDAVSHRAGFVVCGDLEVAARMVSAEPVSVGGPQVKDKIKELVLYSISEEFFNVRAQMGLTIAG
jgi:hypothetical protein